MTKNASDLFAKLGKSQQEKTTQTQPTKTTTRATGKRSNPDYVQVGAYIKRSTDKAVKRLLIDNDEMDFSELVESLLLQWIDDHA